MRWDDGPVAGVDIVDQDLDVFVHADRSWRWKDEDEFAERLALPGDYWVADPDAVRAEGERVIKRSRRETSPSTAPGATSPRTPAGWTRRRCRRAGTARRSR